MTIVDADDFIPTADITSGTAGAYWPATGDFMTLKAAFTDGFPSVITPADADVPAVGIYLTNDGASYTTGKGRVHMLISEVPLAA